MLVRVLKLILLMLSTFALGQTPTVINADFSQTLSLGRNIEYLVDRDESQTFATVIKAGDQLPWTTSDSETPSLGYLRGAVWARFFLQDERLTQRALVLEFPYPPLDIIEVYTIQGEKVHHMRAGDHVPRVEWPLNTRYPSFPLPISQATPGQWIYVKVKSGSAILLDLKIWDERELSQRASREDVLQALYFGALLILALYNFLIYLGTGQPFYASYVLYIVGHALVQASIGGQLHQLLIIPWPKLSDYATSLGIVLSTIGLISFILGVFELKERPAHRRVWRTVGLSIIGLNLLNCLLAFLVSYYWHLMTAFAMVLVVAVYSAVSTVIAFRERERMARWFALAFSVLILGAVCLVLRNIGWIPANSFTTYSFQIGSALEFTLLSFAMADRIKVLQDKIQREQKAALVAEQAAREADLRSLAASESALQEQKRLAALKDQFLANTSHELRTPLNGMIGMSESLISQPQLTVQQRDIALEILGASRRLSKLVNDILDFGAFERGTIPIEVKTLPLQDLVHESLRAQSGLFASKKLRIEHQPPQEVWAIRADRQRCLQVLDAILSNAGKFTDSGSITIRYRQDGETIELGISDTGMGMTSEQMSSLTEAFRQGEGDAARKQGGTGLGLALAHRLMKAQGGSLLIHSSKGVGTTVVLRFTRSQEALPAAAPSTLPEVESLQTTRVISFPAQSTRQEPAALKATGTEVGKSAVTSPHHQNKTESRQEMRILVVDDDDLNRKVVRNYLRDEPYELFEASSGQEALSMITKEGPYDALLLDVMMPGMTGYEVCRKVRELIGPTELPILMLTAKQQVDDLVEGFTSGANDYVYKPFAKGELIARLDTHLQIARTARAMRCFVPQDVIRLLGYEQLSEVSLGDAVVQDMGIIFTDVKGFTSAVEHMQPREVFEWLNRCYRILGPQVRNAGGFIDKYIGDGVMALFPGDPDDAVLAAIAMHRGIRAVEGLRLGTGIHYGQTMLGTLGEPERFEATVLSDAVNIASRIELVSKQLGCGVIVTDDLKKSMRRSGDFQWRHLGAFSLKGRSRPIVLHELLDVDPELELKVSSRDEFEQGIEAFQRGAFQEALLHFDTISKRYPSDTVAQTYAERCRVLKTDAYSFDGTFHMGDKS